MSMNQHQVHGNEGDQYVTTLNQGAYAAGTMMILPENRAYRYCKNGASTGAAGKLAQSPAPVANHVNLAVPVTAVGATSVVATLGATAVTADQYKDGFLVVEDVAGQGFAYRIQSHAAVASAGAFTVPLASSVQKALTASSKVSLIPNPYVGVIVQPSPPTSVLTGVWTTDIAASYWGWVQVTGVASVLQDGVVVAGNLVIPSITVDGAVSPVTTTQAVTDLTIGQAIRNTGDTKYATIDLHLR